MAESRHCPPISRFCRPEAPHPRPEAAASVCPPLLSVHRSWWGTWLPHLCGLILHTVSVLVAPGRCPRITVGSTCSPDLLATPPTCPLGDPLLFDLSILPPQLPVGAPGRLSMTSPPLIVGEMTAWGLSEPCWGEARTRVSRLCSWVQDLSCLPWASRASPASARADSRPSWCLFWVQTTRGGPRKWQLFLPGATWASGAGGPGGAPLSTRTCRFLRPAHLSPAALLAPEPAAHVPGGRQPPAR